MAKHSFEAEQRPSLVNRIQGRSLEWVRTIFGFVEHIPEYYVPNRVGLVAPYPGTSLWTPEDMDIDDTTAVGAGVDLPLSLSLPVRGILRHWLLVSVFTSSTVTGDAEAGLQYGGINFPIWSSAGFSNDDGSSFANLLCQSVMNPYCIFRNANVASNFTIRGIFLDYPEGEVPSIPTLTAMSLAT